MYNVWQTVHEYLLSSSGLHTYLLLTEFEGCTVCHGPPSFHFNLWWVPSMRALNWSGKKGKTITNHNKKSKDFLVCFPAQVELESTPGSQAVHTLEYGLLNQPITAHLVLERSNKVCDRQSLHMTASFLCVEYIPLTKQVQGLHCKLWTAFFPTSMAQVQSTSAKNLHKCKKQGAVTYSTDW